MLAGQVSVMLSFNPKPRGWHQKLLPSAAALGQLFEQPFFFSGKFLKRIVWFCLNSDGAPLPTHLWARHSFTWSFPHNSKEKILTVWLRLILNPQAGCSQSLQDEEWQRDVTSAGCITNWFKWLEWQKCKWLCAFLLWKGRSGHTDNGEIKGSKVQITNIDFP